MRAGAITPIQRWASMFSGWGLQNLDGTAWYHPLRLTIDSGAVGRWRRQPGPVRARRPLDGRLEAAEAPADLRLRCGARRPERAHRRADAGGDGAHPARNLKLVNRQATYAHNDPSAAEPKVNAFFKRLIPFLRKISAGKEAKAKKK